MKHGVIILAGMLLLLASCKSQGDLRQPNVSAEMTISGLSDSCWTYFSFEKGEVVGSSTYCDEDQDAQWAQRSDWDFAICSDKIKTNSGESGKGLGGVQRNTTDAFSTLETAPSDGYLTDIKIRAK